MLLRKLYFDIRRNRGNEASWAAAAVIFGVYKGRSVLGVGCRKWFCLLGRRHCDAVYCYSPSFLAIRALFQPGAILPVCAHNGEHVSSEIGRMWRCIQLSRPLIFDFSLVAAQFVLTPR